MIKKRQSEMSIIDWLGEGVQVLFTPFLWIASEFSKYQNIKNLTLKKCELCITFWSFKLLQSPFILGLFHQTILKQIRSELQVFSHYTVLKNKLYIQYHFKHYSLYNVHNTTVYLRSKYI